MSKRALDAASKIYPPETTFVEINSLRFVKTDRRAAFIKGYELAEENIISLIDSRIGEILGDAQPAPILREELREIIKRIKQ